MIKKILLLSVLFVKFCYCLEPFVDKPPSPRKDVLLVRDINKKTIIKLKQEKNLRSFGTSACMMYEITMLGLSFVYYNPIDVLEARNLIIYTVDEYLDAINSNVELRPYLDHWPFTAKDVELDITILKPNGAEVDAEKLNFVSCKENVVRYYQNKPESKSMPPPLVKESYEEASQLLKDSKVSPFLDLKKEPAH
jgi:hypothetical protein